jgi:preprotein translocase subunit SecD
MKARNLPIIVPAIIVGGLAFVLIDVNVLRNFESGPLSKAPDHGTSFLIEAAFPESTAGTNDLAALKETMLARADRLGVRIFYEPVSPTRVRLSVPVTNPDHARQLREAICRGGLLEFRLVREGTNGFNSGSPPPDGCQLLEHETALPNGQKRVEIFLVRQAAEPGLAGPLLKDAMVTRNNVGKPEIVFRMRPRAADAFARVTRENVGRRLAVIVDGKVVTAPIIRSPIEGGSGVIEGDFDPREAFGIATALDSPLPVPVKVIEWKDY